MKNNYVFCTKCSQTNLFVGHYPICWWCGMPLEDPNKPNRTEEFNICESMFKNALLAGIAPNKEGTLLKVLLDVDKVTDEHWEQLKQIHIPECEKVK